MYEWEDIMQLPVIVS
ncbi:Protein of unknown function [Bacillus wiedmannii]|nr:Protein of unknown function [Bacillus wiedmannii]